MMLYVYSCRQESKLVICPTSKQSKTLKIPKGSKAELQHTRNNKKKNTRKLKISDRRHKQTRQCGKGSMWTEIIGDFKEGQIGHRWHTWRSSQNRKEGKKPNTRCRGENLQNTTGKHHKHRSEHKENWQTKDYKLFTVKRNCRDAAHKSHNKKGINTQHTQQLNSIQVKPD